MSTSFAQSSSLYRSAKARAAGTVDAGVGVPTTQPAGGVAGANANAVAQVGANNALRISAGSSPVPAAPKNLTLIQHSLTAVAPPEATQVKVHDLIGIIVRHRFRSQTDSRMQQKNEWDVQSKLEAWFRIHDKKWQQQNLAGGKPEIDFQHENEMKNQGRSNRQDVVETRVMGKVIDVKPNGNLIVVGASKISYGEDGQILMLSGEINSRDVLPDRTITSDKIYDLDVEIKNSGTVSEAVKRGWLKEVLDGVKPF
ncbi:MAG TPA: flagellar basal body L-ring protein FlgH [Phycisphaerae bacterium]|nr:flagellar basal body L-ring protein FlgH [Phycisphaerae bacterium]